MITYKDIVNRIQTVVDEHYMLADFGYGDLSDLKTRFENTSGDAATQTNYPYLFLNPATHTRSGAAVTYNFNMIVMDMARGEVSDQPFNNMLTIQSQCQQYIDDVIAKLYLGFTDAPEVLFSSLSYNTFNERFQDEVAGMTVNLQITVPQPINNCITPFDRRELLVFARNTIERVIDPDPNNDKVYVFDQILITDGNWTNTNRYEVPIGGTGFYRIALKLIFKLIEPAVGEAPSTPPVIRTLQGPPTTSTDIAGTISQPWPTFETPNTVYTRDMEFTVFATAPPTVNDFTLLFVQAVDTPGVPDAAVIEMPNSEIKIFKAFP